MPNLVDNVITITGPEADIAHFLDHCFAVDEEGDDPAFDFDCIIPLPSEDECAGPYWGTRKNALETAFMDQQPDCLLLWISTANNIPEPVYRRLGELYPALYFFVMAIEPSNGWAVTMHVSGEHSRVDGADFCAVYELIHGEPLPGLATDEGSEW
ncbi:hypothetical protein [Microvirga sp. P5_D2]